MFNHSLDKREIHFTVTGKNLTSYPGVNNAINIIGHRCVGPCLEDIVSVAIEGTKRLWSNASNWPNGELPKAGEDVIIEPGWDMIYDLPDSPIF